VKIIFIAKHGNGKCDDEGSIVYSLEQLGHEVYKVTETQANLSHVDGVHYDLCLFNHWDNLEAIDRIKIPKVFWYFDLVAWPDPAVAPRCQTRIRWMAEIIPRVDLGFCTDGDWVNKDKSGKLVRLTQGADPRTIGRGKQTLRNKFKILFTGMEKECGIGREKFVVEMRERYGYNFNHHEGRGGSGVYRYKLAHLIANTHIVVAPNAPVTDHYWSNRVYNALGYGAFLLHPYCETLDNQFMNGIHLETYRDMQELHDLIEEYLHKPEEMKRISESAINYTKKNHTYINRCETLINTVQERLGI
jgi:hypothetical protein